MGLFLTLHLFLFLNQQQVPLQLNHKRNNLSKRVSQASFLRNQRQHQRQRQRRQQLQQHLLEVEVSLAEVDSHLLVLFSTNPKLNQNSRKHLQHLLYYLQSHHHRNLFLPSSTAINQRQHQLLSQVIVFDSEMKKKKKMIVKTNKKKIPNKYSSPLSFLQYVLV